MKRLLTAALALPLVGAAVFGLSGLWIFVILLAAVELAVLEYTRLVRKVGAGRVAGLLPYLVPIAAFGLIWQTDFLEALGTTFLLAAGLVATGGVAVAALASRGEFGALLAAVGALAFGLPFFSVAVASLYRVHEFGPWVFVLLLAIVWVGDSAAYYVGSAWGHRKLAPLVSPNKTWLGAIASFGAALGVAYAWSRWRLPDAMPQILIAAGLTSVAAQLGDLIESMFKRAVGVKDSGSLLPGHGGMLDRLDALLLAGPVFFLALEALDFLAP